MERAQRGSQQEDESVAFAALLVHEEMLEEAQHGATATATANSVTIAPPAVSVVAIPPIKRTCICCTEEGKRFIRPCSCSSDYCEDCLAERFTMALNDKSTFPARCCKILQLYTVLPQLSSEQANEYRSAFEEWMAKSKTYCPNPRCSTFISDRTMEEIKSRPRPTLRECLSSILTKMDISPSARFFREETDITHLPGNTPVPADPIHLAAMKAKLDRYMFMDEFTQDVQLIVGNAHFHGSGHPIAQAADELLALCLHEISEFVSEQLLDKNSSFACPVCRVGICFSCKNIAHPGNACDTTAHNKEMAMLAKFGYKQCPRCGHAVRKMFGCSHVVCRCGAGFCYRCCRSIDLCAGGCDGEDDDTEDDIRNEANTAEGEAEVQSLDNDGMPPEPRNLDAGGDRRWQNEDLDFGDEPEEDAVHQVWSCAHSWRKLREIKDGFFHGDPDLIECNRCFKNCAGGKGTSTCRECTLVVCSGCRERIQSSGP